jgi:hypothetical protein
MDEWIYIAKEGVMECKREKSQAKKNNANESTRYSIVL